jgi:hypothetical protein
MTAISALRAEAREKYPDFPLDFEDGTVVVLRSSLRLDEEELQAFSDAHKELLERDGNDDYAGLKRQFVEVLSLVATDPDIARSYLAKEDLATLTGVMKAYSNTSGDGEAPKS